jgi:two-component system LytT family sensor kinase
MPAPASPFAPASDRLLRIVGPIVLFLTGFMFFRLKMYLDLPPQLLVNQVCIALSAGYIGWELTRFTAIKIQKRYPGLGSLRQRVLILVLALIVLSHFGYAYRRVTHNIFDNDPWIWPTLLDYSGTMGVVIFYTTVTLGLYEGAYLWLQWKQTFAEKEKLIQSEWQAKYDLLKAQINPHFLFNSLNSLSSLISENPIQAERFTDEMSRVYRYLLRSNDQELVPLADELEFIRSYGHLLKTRHGDGFRLQIDVDASVQDHLLPSLTLQLLVENAVKHNIVVKEKPLTVIIKSCDRIRLVVQNNIQKKTITVPSNGIGLANINAKFRLMNKDGISINTVGDQFAVNVALIPPF